MAKNNKKIVIGLLVVALAIIAISFLPSGTFSAVTSFGVIEGEEPITDFDLRSSGCKELRGVSSIKNAPSELGTEQYFSITSTKSLVELDGKVYSCG